MYLYSLAGLGLQYLNLYQYGFSYLLDPDVLVQPGWAGAAVPQPVPQRLVAPSQVENVQYACL